MARIHKSELTDNLKRLSGLQQSEAAPNQITNWVQPTLSVDPSHAHIAKFNGSNTTGVVVAYTTPTDKDFYITSLHASLSKDAACDLVTCHVQCVINGETISLLIGYNPSLTANNYNRDISFPFPIKVDRNSNIQITGAFTVGVCYRGIAVSGFLI